MPETGEHWRIGRNFVRNWAVAAALEAAVSTVVAVVSCEDEKAIGR